MSGNPYAWLGLVGAVIAVLAHKGYFSSSPKTAVPPQPTVSDLAALGQSFALAVKAQAGHAFALAVKAEADLVIARQFAQEAVTTPTPALPSPFHTAAPVAPAASTTSVATSTTMSPVSPKSAP